jgi:HAD superfamily hydrolase (TIGR01509 family)
VLVDSEPISNRALADTLAKIGWEIGFDETVERFLGRSMASCLAIIEERMGPVPEWFEAEYRREMFAGFERELRPVEGIEAALDSIDLPVCVASSGDHGKIVRNLRLTGLYERFEGRIFSAIDVARGKPAPDLFLFAAGKMGAVPERCLVIEDGIPGVQAAVAAGMRVLGFVGSPLVPAGLLEDAGATVFRSMRELPELIAAMLDASEASISSS